MAMIESVDPGPWDQAVLYRDPSRGEWWCRVGTISGVEGGVGGQRWRVHLSFRLGEFDRLDQDAVLVELRRLMTFKDAARHDGGWLVTP